jgi:hypothetical protein
MSELEEFRLRNRAEWRIAVQSCLGVGGDIFAVRRWTSTRDIAKNLKVLLHQNLTYGLTPGGGGYEFTDVVDWDEETKRLHLLSGGDEHHHLMVVEHLDYVPHPLDSADAVFRLQLETIHADEALGPVYKDDFRQMRTAPDYPEEEYWIAGAFVFTAKQGALNDANLDHDDFGHLDTIGLKRLIKSL